MAARIDALFDALLAAGGSNLHLGVGYPPLMRVRGDLTPMRDRAMDPPEMESLLFEIATPEQKKTITETLDLDFAYAYGDKARFRANYFYKTTGLAAVFRTIPTKVLTLEDLRCPPVLRKLADRRIGSRSRHRAHGVGQVDDSRGDDRPHQQVARLPRAHD